MKNAAHGWEQTDEARGRVTAEAEYTIITLLNSETQWQVTALYETDMAAERLRKAPLKNSEIILLLAKAWGKVTSLQTITGNVYYYKLNEANNLQSLLLKTREPLVYDLGGRNCIAAWKIPALII